VQRQAEERAATKREAAAQRTRDDQAATARDAARRTTARVREQAADREQKATAREATRRAADREAARVREETAEAVRVADERAAAQRTREADARAREETAAREAQTRAAAAAVPELVMYDIPIEWSAGVYQGKVIEFEDEELGRIQVTAPPGCCPGGEYIIKGVPSTKDPRAHVRAAAAMTTFLQRKGLVEWEDVFVQQLGLKTVLQLHELTVDELRQGAAASVQGLSAAQLRQVMARLKPDASVASGA
jgi:flagellar biosynthesis GTPase FlhF